MGDEESGCGVCGGPLPLDARFCPRCGVPVGTTLAGSVEVDQVSSVDVTAVGSLIQRSRLVVTVAALAGAVLLTWSIVSSNGGSTDSAGSTTTVATVVVSTTIPVAVTEATSEGSEERSTISTASGSIYVNGVRGPVLGEGVEGVLLASTGALRLTLIDLGTGEITFIPHGLPNRGEIAAVAGEEILIRNGRFLRTINLRTEVESDAIPFNESDGFYGWWLAGSGGPDSVWVVKGHEPTDSDGSTLAASASTVLRVDFTGRTLQSFEFEAPFSVRFANGTDLYLEGPSGSSVFDTVTNSVTALNGQIIETNSAAVVLLSCDPTLECHVSIDIGTGMTPTTALTAADVTNSQLHIAPDFTRALAHRGDEELTYIDLVTGDRFELRWPIDPYAGVLWIPDTPWIVGVGVEVGGGAADGVEFRFGDLTAVNTDTGAIIELRLLPRSGAGWELSRFGLITAS